MCMMEKINLKAYAKLNLSLDVLGKLDNGYHALRMVMQSASLCDEISIALTDGGIQARSNFKFLPQDERNIANRAAAVFFEAAGLENRGADILLRKCIPVGAGLGGGSSDAAAVLRGLNELTGAGLSPARSAATSPSVSGRRRPVRPSILA